MLGSRRVPGSLMASPPRTHGDVTDVMRPEHGASAHVGVPLDVAELPSPQDLAQQVGLATCGRYQRSTSPPWATSIAAATCPDGLESGGDSDSSDEGSESAGVASAGTSDHELRSTGAAPTTDADDGSSHHTPDTGDGRSDGHPSLEQPPMARSFSWADVSDDEGGTRAATTTQQEAATAPARDQEPLTPAADSVDGRAVSVPPSPRPHQAGGATPELHSKPARTPRASGSDGMWPRGAPRDTGAHPASPPRRRTRGGGRVRRRGGRRQRPQGAQGEESPSSADSHASATSPTSGTTHSSDDNTADGDHEDGFMPAGRRRRRRTKPKQVCGRACVCVCVCVRVRVRCAGVCVSLHGPTCRPMLPTQSATTSPRTHARGRVRGGTAPARAAVPATRPQTTGAPSHPTPTPTPVAAAAAPAKEAQSEARVAVPATAASNTAHSEAAARRGSSSGSSGLQPAEAIVERLRARNMVGVHCCLAQVASVGAAVATLKFAGRESWLEQLVRHRTHCCAGMSTAIARR